MVLLVKSGFEIDEHGAKLCAETAQTEIAPHLHSLNPKPSIASLTNDVKAQPEALRPNPSFVLFAPVSGKSECAPFRILTLG